MRRVPREAFLPPQLREFAYEDNPLPIAEGQTISQPYIVAFMAEALVLEGGERVLEIGTGSGYAAAVLSEIAGEVYTVERICQLAEKAASTLADLGYDNVHVLHGDGTKGWPEHAPYDGIIVAAGGPKVPDALKIQLKIGGRLVIPVGSDPKVQELVRITRISELDFQREDLADVRLYRSSDRKAGQRPNKSGRMQERCGRQPQFRNVLWPSRFRPLANRSSQSKRRNWIACSRALATPGSFYWVRPPMVLRNFTGCAIAYRAN